MKPVALEWLYPDGKPYTLTWVGEDAKRVQGGGIKFTSHPLYRSPAPTVGAASGASPTVDELFALLPSSYYMDPPDGGDVPLIEQLRRMSADAAKYRVEALRDESGWLIEHSGEVLGKQEGSVSWLKANVPNTTNEGGLLGFTSDASAALRFARKEDAQAVLKFQLGIQSPDWYVKPYSVTEHMWPRAALAQQPAQPLVDPVVADPSNTSVHSVERSGKTLPLSPLALANYVSNVVQANDGEPHSADELWGIVIEACAETHRLAEKNDAET